MSFSINRITISGRISAAVPPPVDTYWINTAVLSGGITNSAISSLRADATGNIYAAGTLTESTVRKFLLVKFTPHGLMDWFRARTQSAINIADVAVSPDGTSTSFGDTNTAFSFIRYESDGTPGFARTLSRTGTTAASVVVDSSGNTYSNGYYQDGVNYASLIKLDSAGTRVLSGIRRLTNSTFNTRGFGIALDSAGSIYVGASAATQRNAFAKYDVDGNLVWQSALITGSNTAYHTADLVFDSLGKLYVVGISNTEGAGSNDVMIAKYTVTTNPPTLDWVRNIGTAASEFPVRADVDSSNNIYIAGITSSGTTSGSTDAVIVKLSTSGDLVWQRFFGTTGNDSVDNRLGFSIDDNNNMLLSLGTINTGAVVAKLPSDGSLLGTYGPYTYKAGDLTVNTPTFTVTPATFTSSNQNTASALATLAVTTPPISYSKIDL